MKAAGLALVLSLTLTACSGTPKESATTTTVFRTFYTEAPETTTTTVVTTEATSEPETPVYQMREEALAGPLAFTAIGATFDMRTTSDKDDPLYYPRGQYLSLFVAIKNVSALPQTYNFKYQSLVDKAGRVFAPTDAPNMAVRTAELNPGTETTAMIWFDVPINSTVDDYTAVLTTSPASEPVMIALTET